MLLKLNHLFKRRWQKRVRAGVEMVKLGLLDRLTKKYLPLYGKETADLLAASVVNEIYLHKPSDSAFLEFSGLNKDTVKREICSLMQDKDISYVISQSLRAHTQVANEQGQYLGETALECTERLKGFGVLAITEEILPRHDFLEMAKEFHQGRL